MQEEGAPLRASVGRAMSWKAVSQVISQLTSIVVLVVLAHILTPHEYGLAGMVLVFSTLVFVFADLALGSALVQRADLDALDRDTVFWTSALTGTGFTLAAFALAGPVSGFFDEPAIEPLIRVFSVAFVLTALSTVPYAVLARDLNFRALELRKMGSALLAAAVGIGVALSGGGAWALIAQQVTFAGAGTVLAFRLGGWRPRLRFSKARLRQMGGFGATVFGTRILFFIERNIDNTLVGRVLGPAALGVYSLSYNLMLVPLERIGGPMAEVLFPAFARIQHDHKRTGAAWLRAVRMLAAIVAPAMMLLIALAPDIVPIVMGDQWKSAVPVVQILAWVGLHQSLQRFNSSVLQAVGRTGGLLSYAVLTGCVCTTGFFIGVQWGVVGVAASYAVASTLVAPVYLWVTTRAVSMQMREFVFSVAPVLIAAALAAGLAALARVGIEGAISSPFLRLIVVVPPALAVYLVFCRLIAPALVHDVTDLTPNRVKARAARLRGRLIGAQV